MSGDRPSRPFRLREVESWRGCLEIIVEGGIDPGTAVKLEECLERVVDSDHEYVLIDLDRCGFIDVAAVKHLVLVRQFLSDRQAELLIFGAAGQVRALLEDVGALDCDPAPPRHPGRSPDRRSRRRSAGRHLPAGVLVSALARVRTSLVSLVIRD
jgi:anti-anti-sigma regulatory factor